PEFFKKWFPTAWANILNGLDVEEDSEEISASAEDRFKDKIASALAEQVTLARTTNKQAQRQERRSLLDWCNLFGRRKTRWEAVRGYHVWVCWDPDQKRVRIAITAELFTQLKRRDLEMGKKKFTILCQRYEVGKAVRACKQRAVELSPEFLDLQQPIL